MNRNTRFKPIKDKDPGNAGGKEYGLVKIGLCTQRIEDGLFIQKPSGEWVQDEEFTGEVLNERIVVNGAEKDANGCVWLYTIYAVPRELLKGREDYVREWAREEELPRERIGMLERGIRIVRRILPDGSIQLDIRDERRK